MENSKNIIQKLLSKMRFRVNFLILSLLLILFLFIGAFSFWTLKISAPNDFPTNKVITIEKGTSFKKVAADFEKQHLVRSAFWFDTVGWLLRKREDVKAGEYFFEEPVTAITLFMAITGHEYRDEFIKITIREGLTLRDIGEIFENREMWTTEDLLEVTGEPMSANSPEGYLFPDTYYVPLDISPKSMIEVMFINFSDKMSDPEIQKDIEESGHTLDEIITMASILEREAATKEDREIISGILWKRLDTGMPLQVDAVFPYIMGKHSLQLTLEDLKIDSPYNTYLYKGLPPGAIANPGMRSIKAALNPTETSYWFYLSDKEGSIHYSTTYEEHLNKREQFLGK
ncbi:MAG: endolytic transglycosylase MltG [Candidatus Marinimicrobia bacterium]|nr:endolytic transglycosylase MltG [Candidatus Neomarinimicrobiota bacterium]